MTTFDPRELSDRALLAYLLFGDLARPGWSNRRRQLVRRALVVAAMTVATALVLLGLGVVVVLAWAASL